MLRSCLLKASTSGNPSITCLTGYIPEHECEDVSGMYNVTNSSISLEYVDNCYVEVVNNDTGALIERTECSHKFVRDNTYSSQVFI